MKMKPFSMKQLHERSIGRPRWYKSEVLLSAERLPDGRFMLPESEFRRIRQRLRMTRDRRARKLALRAQRRQRWEWFRRILHGAIGILKAKLGIGLAEKREVQRRLRICESCPASDPQDAPVDQRVCTLKNGGCGCSLKYKPVLADETCPQGKW